MDAGTTLNINGTADLKLSLAAGTGGAINADSFLGKLILTASDTAVASTNTVAQVYDVTVTGGSLAGRYLILDNGDRAMNVADTMISHTGITDALNASDILFAA